jgi:hypothetical protein
MSRTRSIRDWTLDDIPWHLFDARKVDPDILKLVKAASLVEYNGGDYATYLCNVFSDDDEFQAAARAWANEEVRHGRALGRWAEMADESFDFEASFQTFLAGYRLPLEATASVRGSRSGELVARCMVEIGTSSYYTALAEAAEEPVLRAICIPGARGHGPLSPRPSGARAGPGERGRRAGLRLLRGERWGRGL